MKYDKTFTVKEWNRFNKISDMVPDDPTTGRPYQFYNFHNKRYESYDYMTVQEILLHKSDIILTEYKVKPRLNSKDNYFDINGTQKQDPDLSKKELTVKILKNFNMSNFNKGMKIFNDGVKGFTYSIDAVTSQLGDGKNNKDFILPKKKPNQIKIWSNKPSRKKNNIKIWSDDIKKTKKKKGKRKPVQKHSDRWDQHERNLEKIWGKRK